MFEDGLGAFVTALEEFFSKLSSRPAGIGTPYLVKDINEYFLDYTGVISITGGYRGSVFFSTTTLMASQILRGMGVSTSGTDKHMDIVGEVCNTISGNVRREFGEGFMISTPIVMQGKAESMKVSKVKDVYVIPIVWNDIKANLLINVEGSNGA